MGWIADLFKRKVGGTTTGNLLRTVAAAYTNGALGQGRMMITQLDADKRDMSDADFFTAYGKTKSLAFEGSARKSEFAAPTAPLISGTSLDLLVAQTKRFWYIPVSILGGLYVLSNRNKRNYGR